MLKELTGIIYKVEITLQDKFEDDFTTRVLSFLAPMPTTEEEEEDVFLTDEVMGIIEKRYSKSYYVDSISVIHAEYTSCPGIWHLSHKLK